MWDRFSNAEMQRRRALADALVDEHGLDARVLFGNSGVNRHNQANVFWLTHHLDLHHCYLVLSRDGEPALFTGHHVPNARGVSDIHRRMGRLPAGGEDRGTVGSRAPSRARRCQRHLEMGMPYAHYLTIRDRVGEIVDVTGDFQGLRVVKSAEELEWLRHAAELRDRAMVAVAEGARPGMTEVELVALAEHAYRSEGGMPDITFLRSMAMDDPTGCVPAQNPSDRPLQRGDVIITEFSASYWGYSGQLHRPIFVDAEPAPDWQHLFDAALAIYQGLVEAVRTRAAVADAIRAAAPIRDAGFTIYDDLLHGYGVDILPPLIDRERFEDPPAADGPRFERNMAVVRQPNPITPDERLGLQLGALTIVTDAGAESLHHVPLEPLVAA